MPQTAMDIYVTLNSVLTVTEELYLSVCYRLVSFDLLCIAEKRGASVVSVM